MGKAKQKPCFHSGVLPMSSPRCPKCNTEEMKHMLWVVGDSRNGWYCENCGAGPYRLGTNRDAIAKRDTEAEASRFAIKLLN